MATEHGMLPYRENVVIVDTKYPKEWPTIEYVKKYFATEEEYIQTYLIDHSERVIGLVYNEIVFYVKSFPLNDKIDKSII